MNLRKGAEGMQRRTSPLIEWPTKISGDNFLKLFDLYDITTTKVKVRGETYALYNAGVALSIGAGSAGYGLDADITISNNTYVYIKLDRSTPAATLEVASGASPTVPGGDDTTEYYPLWYIAWDSTNSVIDRANIVDLRHAIHMEAMT
jgi:hypothetical protein